MTALICLVEGCGNWAARDSVLCPRCEKDTDEKAQRSKYREGADGN